MRTLIFCLLATAAYGEERAWTVTTDAELVEVRGDTAFLKSGGKITGVPIARLSVADQQYIATLPLAPVRNGSATAMADVEMLPGFATEGVSPASFELPVPQTSRPQSSSGQGTVVTSSDVMSPDSGSQMTGDEHSMLSSPINPPQLGPPVNVSPRAINSNGNANNRRFVQQPKQTQQQQQNKAAADRARGDARPGLFGARARRLANERQ